jgi:hypothetical protein
MLIDYREISFGGVGFGGTRAKSIWRWANKSSSRLDVEEGMEYRNLVREFG